MNTSATETAEAPSSSESKSGQSRRFKVVIVGGGTAGISVAARLCNAMPEPDVAIVEPSETHYYQPLWTLVGGGVVNKEKSARAESGLIPKGATWVRDSVTKLDPDNNQVITAGGETIGYDFLVVACGIEINWEGVKGLAGAVGKNGICSNYDYDTVDYTWQTIKNFQGGTALFTMPPPPIKCAGAPQKIAYLADDAFRKQGVRDKSKIIYAAGTPGIFSAPAYAETLKKVVERKSIETMYQHVLVEIRPDAKEAVFEDRGNDNAEVVVKYDMIHVTPPQRSPQVVRESPLADDGGWLAVDKETLQSPKFDNVFAIGDASSLPTSKTGAAIRKQTPVLVKNLLAEINGQGSGAFDKYDGYTACPLVTGYGKLIMAEFDYELKPTPTFPFDQTKERWSMYQVKRYVLPPLYWNRILRGKA
ncbi:MAG: NAD(P)/FAD-dependent oxidoreductase [Actinobacteria bacterium]|nr:NAD(P)/FAD-dependent oxidoreductase [Actinomycetota bacterium]